MSAVVLTLSTGINAIADERNAFDLRNIPPGDHDLHLWIEGVPQSTLQGLSAQCISLRTWSIWAPVGADSSRGNQGT